MDQMSVFEALDTWDAVEIRPEECLEGRKSADALEDLRKAQWYLEREIERRREAP